MGNSLQNVRGTKDILPDEYDKFHALVELARSHSLNYGFREISLPLFEFSEVFHRGLGDDSDVIGKETYDFQDRGGENITLRPEFTAQIVRAFISNNLHQNLPVKFFYEGAAFRYERPQKGRQRQFHQFGVELIGVENYIADIEVIKLAADILNKIGVKSTLKINSLGDKDSRYSYREKLRDYFAKHQDSLSEISKVRLKNNPLRILDSKDETDKKLSETAPKISDNLSDESKRFFSEIAEGLAKLGVDFVIDDKLVRGLDYYNHTVFEFCSDELGAQDAVLSGGRYDGLIAMLGGADIAGIGFAAGIERLLLLAKMKIEQKSIIAIISADANAMDKSLKIADMLRNKGQYCEIIYGGNFSKMMKKANRFGAGHVIIIGEDEMNGDFLTFKNMTDGEQKKISEAELIGLNW